MYRRGTEVLLPDPATVLGSRGGDGGGYRDLDQDGHWWVPSGRVFYDVDASAGPEQELAAARQHFFKPRRYVDPFGNPATTDYDRHDLLVVQTTVVDLSRGESFGFLGFDFRQVRSLRGAWRAHYTPKLEKRTALLRKLKDMFGRNQSQPVGRVVKLINPVLRGWVNYFAVGHSSECFSFVKDWVEKKIKRHMQRARNRQGFGWTRWSREWTYNTLGLFKGYRVVRPALKAVPAG